MAIINTMHCFLVIVLCIHQECGQESASAVEWVPNSIHFFGWYSCFHSLMECMDVTSVLC